MSIRANRDLRYQKSRSRKKRPKTFKTEDSAKAYAEKNGITNYKLVNLKTEKANIKKIRIVTE